MIRVCDAIMGSGKTSAVITYINEHPDDKFIYLTPYLDEAERIQTSCEHAKFCLPKTYSSECEIGKVNHTYELVKHGENVASTHQALMRYTPKMTDAIAEGQYTLIIDEALNVMEDVAIKSKNDEALFPSPKDLDIMSKYGFINEVDSGEFARTDIDGEGCLYTPILRGMESRFIIDISGKKKGKLRWLFNSDIFRKAKDVIILTYLFSGSEMEQFMKMNGIEFQYTYVSRSRDGKYRLSDSFSSIPEYVYNIKNMIHLCESEKLNSVGSDRYHPTDLSINWYNKRTRENEEMERLRNHIQTFFKYHAKDVPKEQRMVGEFKDIWNKIKASGYAKEEKYGVMFNVKAKNEWGDRHALAYPINIYPNIDIRNYYVRKGFPFNEDQYALSILIQWIWRSAIRNGEEIYLFLPSMRMRNLFKDWLDEVSRGGGETYAA